MPAHEADPHQEGHGLPQRELHRRDEVVGVDHHPAAVLVDGDVHGLQRPQVPVGGARGDAGAPGDLLGLETMRVALEESLYFQDARSPVPLLEAAHRATVYEPAGRVALSRAKRRRRRGEARASEPATTVWRRGRRGAPPAPRRGKAGRVYLYNGAAFASSPRSRLFLNGG